MALCSTEFLRDPVAFLTRNAIAIDYTGCGGGVNQVVVEDYGQGLAKQLRKSKPSDGSSFAAYFLPYADGQTFQITLGNQANIMFTPPLTGCSFFIDKNWWSPTVAHVNRQTALGGIDQVAIDTSARTIFGPQYSGLQIVANYYGVRKDDYTPHGESAQNNRLYVVGVRGTLGWYLYRMKHDPMTNEVVEAPNRIN